MTYEPCGLPVAAAFIRQHHRHLKRVPARHRFSLLARQDGRVVGVAVVGRPVARHMDDGWTLEISRLCTDGTPNAVSFLIAAVKRAGRGLHYRRLISYTLQAEPGTGWRAAGMVPAAKVKGRPWNHTPGKRNRKPVNELFRLNSNNDHPLEDKVRWEVAL